MATQSSWIYGDPLLPVTSWTDKGVRIKRHAHYRSQSFKRVTAYCVALMLVQRGEEQKLAMFRNKLHNVQFNFGLKSGIVNIKIIILSCVVLILFSKSVGKAWSWKWKQTKILQISKTTRTRHSEITMHIELSPAWTCSYDMYGKSANGFVFTPGLGPETLDIIRILLICIWMMDCEKCTGK